MPGAYFNTGKWVFVPVQHAFRLIKIHFWNPQIIKQRIQRPADMTEGHGAMVRVTL